MSALSLTRVCSRNHPVVKLARSLKSRHGRKKHSLGLVEGPKAIEAALENGRKARAALIAAGRRTGKVTEVAGRVAGAGARLYELPRELFRELTGVESPQGLVLLCETPAGDLAGILAAGFVVVADRVQDPGNLGTLLRCARAFGVSGVVTTKGSAEAANPKAIRASAGAWSGVPLVEGVDVDRLLEELAGAKFSIVVAAAGAARHYSRAPWRGRVALVLGNEGRGADRRFSARPSLEVKIPMSPGAESLNVGAAAAILLAEAFRQRTGQE